MDWADEKAADLEAACGQYDEISIVDIAAALRAAHIAGLKEALEIVKAAMDNRNLSYSAEAGSAHAAISARISELEGK